MSVAASLNPHTTALMALVDKYDGRAPRYTSYPTAVQFTPQVDARTYQRWLSELPTDEAVSLYAHIPMCARLCWYCGCNTRAVNRADAVSDYVALLVQELALVEPILPGRLRASALHLGGGTPNMLGIDDLRVLFEALRHLFRLEADAEIAAELDPAVLTEAWVKAAAFHGLNRASLGVQNLSPRVQQAVNREERFEDIARCVGWLRAAGVASINLDLMYGLPHQTTANTLSTIHQVVSLRPERIALFGYAHVPWMKSHQQLIDEAALPGPAERLEQSEAAAELLAREGYVRIGLDHFALESDELAVAHAQKRLKRNFQGYTVDAAATLLGFGASAISSLPQGFVQNHAQELAWRKAVGAGESPIARGVALTDEDRWRGEIIERLMCDMGVDLAAVSARHGRDWRALQDEVGRLAPFVADGLLRIDGAKLTVTETGRLLVRSICAAFDAYFAPQAQRHSKAL
ncbi:MAG: oxygen-independent coproporphyrinogen III oxidase [Phenylobacterium sp.]|uniref:oxygen-independent coproporphyrinogen III oxidase n=1 Tax=Phenylobacterium sp. TaxID=1871053 RepID=UPI003918DA8B